MAKGSITSQASCSVPGHGWGSKRSRKSAASGHSSGEISSSKTSAFVRITVGHDAIAAGPSRPGRSGPADHLRAKLDVLLDRDGAPLLTARDARQEAQQKVGDGFAARVLEPSPPAVVDDEWFADDPVTPGVTAGVPVVSPVLGTDLTWGEWARDRPEHAPWAAARWLGAYDRLPRPPARFAETRLALHRLAAYVVSPARRRVNTKMALRWTLGGLGTPFFGADEQVRIVGTQIVRQRDSRAQAEPVTTLAAAAAFVLDGAPDIEWAERFDVPPAGDPGEELPVDAHAAEFLGDWYGFGTSVLEELRSERESTEPSRVQLWPEHFDVAIDCLPGDRRAGFGASPGDAAVDEPYLYVVPHAPDAARTSDVWNAESFRGAILPMSDLVDVPDQRTAALTFFRRARDLLRT